MIRVCCLALLLAGCATEAWPPRVVSWGEPRTEWFLVPKDVQFTEVYESAESCGAKITNSVAVHGLVPVGFSSALFKFVEENTDEAKQCTIEKLGAVPQLSPRFEKNDW